MTAVGVGGARLPLLEASGAPIPHILIRLEQVFLTGWR
jgi:hypothetical protein